MLKTIRGVIYFKQGILYKSMKKLIIAGIIVLIAIVVTVFWAFLKISSSPSTSTSTPPVSGTKGTVTGKVLLGPTCPVEHNPPLPGCAPKPYETTVDVKSVAPAESYAVLKTDSSGSFKISLLPGSYSFQAQGKSPFPFCSAVQVDVVSGETQDITINCDTGIR